MNKVLCKDDINLIKVLGDNNCLFNCIIQYLHLNKNIINHQFSLLKKYIKNIKFIQKNDNKEYCLKKHYGFNDS